MLCIRIPPHLAHESRKVSINRKDPLYFQFLSLTPSARALQGLEFAHEQTVIRISSTLA